MNRRIPIRLRFGNLQRIWYNQSRQEIYVLGAIQADQTVRGGPSGSLSLRSWQQAVFVFDRTRRWLKWDGMTRSGAGPAAIAGYQQSTHGTGTRVLMPAHPAIKNSSRSFGRQSGRRHPGIPLHNSRHSAAAIDDSRNQEAVDKSSSTVERQLRVTIFHLRTACSFDAICRHMRSAGSSSYRDAKSRRMRIGTSRSGQTARAARRVEPAGVPVRRSDAAQRRKPAEHRHHAWGSCRCPGQSRASRHYAGHPYQILLLQAPPRRPLEACRSARPFEDFNRRMLAQARQNPMAPSGVGLLAGWPASLLPVRRARAFLVTARSIAASPSCCWRRAAAGRGRNPDRRARSATPPMVDPRGLPGYQALFG